MSVQNAICPEKSIRDRTLMNLFQLRKSLIKWRLKLPRTQVRTISNKHLDFVRQPRELLHLKAMKRQKRWMKSHTSLGFSEGAALAWERENTVNDLLLQSNTFQIHLSKSMSKATFVAPCFLNEFHIVKLNAICHYHSVQWVTHNPFLVTSPCPQVSVLPRCIN